MIREWKTTHTNLVSAVVLLVIKINIKQLALPFPFISTL